MDRHAVLEMMSELKLAGMRAAYDEVLVQAVKRQQPVEHVIGELLAAQLADVRARSTAYRMGNAKFPVMKKLAECQRRTNFGARSGVKFPHVRQARLRVLSS